MIERVGSQASERRTERSDGLNPLGLRSGRSESSASQPRASRVIPPNPTRPARSHYCTRGIGTCRRTLSDSRGLVGPSLDADPGLNYMPKYRDFYRSDFQYKANGPLFACSFSKLRLKAFSIILKETRHVSLGERTGPLVSVRLINFSHHDYRYHQNVFIRPHYHLFQLPHITCPPADTSQHLAHLELPPNALDFPHRCRHGRQRWAPSAYDPRPTDVSLRISLHRADLVKRNVAETRW
jgi:hypothetical protein